LDLSHYLFMAAVFVIAGVIQGFSGFGFGIFSMSLLPLAIEIKFAALVCALVATAPLATNGWELRRRLPWRSVWPLLPGVLLASVGGAKFFRWATSPVLVALLAVVVLFTGLRGLFSRRSNAPTDGEPSARPIRPGWFLGTLLGLVAGFLGAVINMPGPPLIIYAYVVAGPSAARAFLTVVFICVLSIRIVVFQVEGLWTWHTAGVAAVMVPVAALAAWLGGHIHHRLPKAMLVRVAHGVLVALAALLVAKAFDAGLPALLGGNT